MALHEGCRRLRKVGKVFIFFGLGFALLGTILICFGSAFQILNAASLMPLVLVPTFFAEVAGIALWVIAWVVEGFALPSSTESGHARGD